MDNLLHRKESIILTTIDLIDKYGIHQVSTREIAKSQGITEGAIYRHFKSKNELFLEVLAFFSKYDKDIFYTANKKDNSIDAVSASPKSPKADKVACPDIARYNDHIKAKEKGCLLFA